MDPNEVERRRVFLNIPYDPQPKFRRLYIAYIVGVIELGLIPTATLAIEGDARLDRIFALIKSSRYSIHDLSCIKIDRTFPPTPRFNMPFELGLAVAWAKQNPASHSFFAFEEIERRGHKSTSDMSGYDFYIHSGKPERVMSNLCDAFVRKTKSPNVPKMVKHFEIVLSRVPQIKRDCGAASIFQARVFKEIVLAAMEIRRADL
jgi:hypothetical protein